MIGHWLFVLACMVRKYRFNRRIARSPFLEWLQFWLEYLSLRLGAPLIDEATRLPVSPEDKKDWLDHMLTCRRQGRDPSFRLK